MADDRGRAREERFGGRSGAPLERGLSLFARVSPARRWVAANRAIRLTPRRPSLLRSSDRACDSRARPSPPPLRGSAGAPGGEARLLAPAGLRLRPSERAAVARGAGLSPGRGPARGGRLLRGPRACGRPERPGQLPPSPLVFARPGRAAKGLRRSGDSRRTRRRRPHGPGGPGRGTGLAAGWSPVCDASGEGEAGGPSGGSRESRAANATRAGGPPLTGRRGRSGWARRRGRARHDSRLPRTVTQVLLNNTRPFVRMAEVACRASPAHPAAVQAEHSTRSSDFGRSVSSEGSRGLRGSRVPGQ